MFGFPNFYGNNMNAWIDCLTSLDAPEDGMTKIHCEPGAVVSLQLENVKDFERRCPDQYKALIECSDGKQDRPEMTLMQTRWVMPKRSASLRVIPVCCFPCSGRRLPLESGQSTVMRVAAMVPVTLAPRFPFISKALNSKVPV